MKLFSVVELKSGKVVDFFENKKAARVARDMRNKDADGNSVCKYKISKGPDHWKNKLNKRETE